VNAAFLDHCKNDLSVRREKPVDPPKSAVKPIKEAKTPKPAPRRENTALSKRLNEKFQVELNEKQARTAKIDKEMRLLEMKEMKLSGQLIPTDLVANTIRQLMQTTMVSFNDAADALLVDLAKMLKIDRQKMAELRKKLKGIVNDAVNRSVNEAQKNVHNIAQEHSQQRKKAA
jgi:hypothetical protein